MIIRFRCKFVGKVGQVSVQINMGHFACKMTLKNSIFPCKTKASGFKVAERTKHR